MISSRKSSSTNGPTATWLFNRQDSLMCIKLDRQNITIASRRTPVNVGQSLAKCPTLDIKIRFREGYYYLYKSSPTAAIAVTGGVALLSHSSYNAIMLEPESPELDSITLFTKRHLQPPGMLTNLHSLPSRQGIVGTGVCTAPPLLAAAPSCRYLKQGCQPTVWFLES